MVVERATPATINLFLRSEHRRSYIAQHSAYGTVHSMVPYQQSISWHQKTQLYISHFKLERKRNYYHSLCSNKSFNSITPHNFPPTTHNHTHNSFFLLPNMKQYRPFNVLAAVMAIAFISGVASAVSLQLLHLNPKSLIIII